MKVECPTCQKVYNFPDDRLAALKKRTFNCPACKGMVTIDLPPAENENAENIAKTGNPREIDPSDELMAEITKAIEDLEPMPEVMSTTLPLSLIRPLSITDWATRIGAVALTSISSSRVTPR